MIKASEGGGGKGVRMVNEGSEVASAYRQVQGEVPGSPIFIMKLASKARHLEVQLLADEHGNAIALNGRDCSVQRRFQKIIEEGPPTVVKSKEMWAKMEMAAVALAKEVGYANLGTVEYLYMYETDTFAFLELNPRLQVEHPVTEMITGVNLPATQLQVAMGIPLNGIPDIRRLYGRAPYSKEPLDFTDGSSAHPERIPVKGHCVAARITAENPDAGFQPTSGTIEEINFRSTPDVWGYFSVDSSGTVHEYADSQFGHLFAHGENRDAARKNMIVALKELSIRGEIRTTTEYIVQMLTSQDFIENKINTAWLDARLKQGKDTVEAIASSAAPELVATVGALVTFVEKLSSVYADFTAMLKRGQAPRARHAGGGGHGEPHLRGRQVLAEAEPGGRGSQLHFASGHARDILRARGRLRGQRVEGDRGQGAEAQQRRVFGPLRGALAPSVRGVRSEWDATHARRPNLHLYQGLRPDAAVH